MFKAFHMQIYLASNSDFNNGHCTLQLLSLAPAVMVRNIHSTVGGWWLLAT